VPEEIALLDSVHYSCLGSSPPSILWQTGNAENGNDPAAEALRTTLIREGGTLPATGWLEAQRSDSQVLYIHSSGPPRLQPFSYLTVKRAADGSWGYGGLGVGVLCNKHDKDSMGAPWRLAARPLPTDRTLQVEVQLQSCGHPTPDQVVPRPQAFYGRHAVDIVVDAPRINTGDIACARWYPFTITLDHPIGNRALYDASRLPLLQRWPK
jgi:hypothetical protein